MPECKIDELRELLRRFDEVERRVVALQEKTSGLLSAFEQALLNYDAEVERDLRAAVEAVRQVHAASGPAAGQREREAQLAP